MPAPPPAVESPATGLSWLRRALLLAWAIASFGVCWFARDLQQVVAGWPLNFWFAAQGGVLVYLAIVMIYAGVLNRHERRQPDASADEN